MDKHLKIIHTADLQYSRENKDQALTSLDLIRQKGKDEEVDLFVIAGDLFDRAVNNTSSSGFPELIEVICQILEVAPIVAVYGTPTHDLPGCYEPFKKLWSKGNFVVLQPGKPYLLDSKNYKVMSNYDEGNDTLLLLGCPEPSKSFVTGVSALQNQTETDSLIKTTMKQIFVGCGAFRQKFKGLPCIFVYHGAVAGIQILSQKEIQIGKDDLTLIGADYYALGHIHEAQRISGTEAFYSGSAFPVTWGELTKKGFNLITIKEGRKELKKGDTPELKHILDRTVEVKFIPLPWPIRKKIIREDSVGINPEEVKNFQVWVQYKLPKEKARSVDTVNALKNIMNFGAAAGSKVEVVTVPVETIRSAEIANVQKLRDKIQIYAELSDEKVAESVLTKADFIENYCTREGFVSKGMHIRIQKLGIRGSEGIWKGQGKDEIWIDFDKYGPGLLAVIGPNGAGKTTFFENCHPIPQMLTRTGKLQDHFRLRDSFRDLYFIDEKTGIEYRALIKIDGLNPSGSKECFLYQKRTDNLKNYGEYVPLEGINGREEPYKEHIRKMFGSLSLLVKSVLITQKPPKGMPELSEATKTEKKAIFTELGGFDKYDVHAEFAKLNKDKLTEEATRLYLKLEAIEPDVEKLPEVEKEALSKINQLDKIKSELSILQKEERDLEDELRGISKEVELNKNLRIELDNAAKELTGFMKKKGSLEDEIFENREILSNKNDLQEAKARLKTLQNQELKLVEKNQEISKERERLQSEYNTQYASVATRDRELRQKKDNVFKDVAGLDKEGDAIITERERLRDEITVPYKNCPTCGQEWPEEKLAEFEQKRLMKIRKIEELSGKCNEIAQNLKELDIKNSALEGDIGDLRWPKEPVLPELDEDSLYSVREEIRLINPEAIEEALGLANKADTIIEQSEKELDEVIVSIKANHSHQDIVKKSIDFGIVDAYENKKAELVILQDQVTEKDRFVVQLDTEIRGLREELVGIKQKEQAAVELREQARLKETDRSEYEWLQRACGKDGIQALELEVMGPTIADIANKILESAYGARFQIEFQTTRTAGKGSQKKQIEDFIIMVHDTRDGSSQPLEMLSGGEEIWVKRSIYDAFAIKRDQKTGCRFLTVFQDEMDGALDPEARLKYFQMLEKAHQESGRHQTLVITHSPEAQDLIGQKIVF